MIKLLKVSSKSVFNINGSK